MDAGQVAVLGAVLVAVTGLVSTLVTLLVTRRGQDSSAADSLRDDLMIQLGRQDQRIQQLEQRVSASDARFQAREAQLTEWGMWATDNPPRRPPSFVWPPISDTTPVPGPGV